MARLRWNVGPRCWFGNQPRRKAAGSHGRRPHLSLTGELPYTYCTVKVNDPVMLPEEALIVTGVGVAGCSVVTKPALTVAIV